MFGEERSILNKLEQQIVPRMQILLNLLALPLQHLTPQRIDPFEIDHLLSSLLTSSPILTASLTRLPALRWLLQLLTLVPVLQLQTVLALVLAVLLLTLKLEWRYETHRGQILTVRYGVLT